MIEMVSLAEDFIERHKKSVAADFAARRRRASPKLRRSSGAPAAKRTTKSKAPGEGWCSNFAAATPCWLSSTATDLAAAQPGRRGDAGSHHPHQELAAGLAGAAARQARRLRARGTRGGERFRRALSPIFRAVTTTASAASSRNSIPCPASCWFPGSVCLDSAAPSAMRSSPPILPRNGSPSSPAPKRSAASSRSPRPTCSTANIGRWNRAKLGARKEPPLAGQIAVVTGAAGAIGAATAKAFAAAGAEVALLDLNLAAAREKAEAISATALAVQCDVTDAGFRARGVRSGGCSLRRRRYPGLQCRRGLARPHRRSRRRNFAQKLRAEFLRPAASGAGRDQNHAGAEKPADACSSTSPNRPSIQDPISALTASRKRRCWR